MKRFLAEFLAILLIFSVPALAGDYDHIISLLEDGQYDAAIREIEALRDGGQPDGNQVCITSEPDYFGHDWGFPVHIENNWGVGVTLERLDILDFLDGEPAGTFEWSSDQLADLGLDGVFLGPGDTFDWGDGHPAEDWFNSRQYVFSFRGDDGESYVFVREFIMSAQPAEEPDSVPEENVIYNCTPPLTVGSDWIFEIVIANIWNETLTLDSLAIVDLMDGETVDARTWPREQLGEIGLGEFVAGPSSATGWNDAHPAVDYFNGRQYIFTLLSEDGTEYRIVREFDMTGATPQPEAEPMGVGGRSWSFPIGMVNDTESALTLLAMDITDYLGGEQQGTYIFEGEESLADIGLGGIVLQPGEPFSWLDGHPAVDWFDGRVYRFHFRDEAGETVSYSFPFENLSAEAADYSVDEGRDLAALRHDAEFEVEIVPGVYWVPAVALGESRYTNAEVHAMLNGTPEEKQAGFATLYEALQLYQVGGFASSDDNIRIFDGAVNWEHHKPGYYAVLTNNGCCATDSNWLRYILDGDYDEVGYIAYSQRDGSGHVYSYIRQGEWYYVIDLTHYRAADPMCGTESGNLNDYYATDFILGNIHKTDDLALYADYLRSVFNDPPVFICAYTATDVPAVEAVPHDGVLYADENNLSLTVLYAEEGYVNFTQLPAPAEHPEW